MGRLVHGLAALARDDGDTSSWAHGKTVKGARGPSWNGGGGGCISVSSEYS